MRFLPCSVLLLLWVCACESGLGEAPGSPGSTSSPIINGASDSGHPAVGAIWLSEGLCTGTLISPKIVLTAAHCLEGGSAQAFVIGSSVNGQELAVKYGIQHPNYEAEHLEKLAYIGWHDIAVLVLKNPAPVTPMAWRTESLEGMKGQKVTFVGFGENHTGYKYKVTTTIGDIWSQGFWNFVSSSYPGNTCSGDSGGPALLTVNGVEQVVGVVSSGDPYCNQDGYNTRVDTNADFIQQMIEKYDPGSVTSPVCGNNKCETGESKTSCPADCGASSPVCGNGTCESGESKTSCPADCGGVTGCGSITWEGCCDGQTLTWCENGQVQKQSCAGSPKCGWNSGEGYYDCGTSGGSDPSGQNSKSCSVQSACGNGKCESGETAQSCPADCGPPPAVCGNGTCESGETAQSCPADCGPPPAVCGNGTCESGETAEGCPADCGSSGPACGNGSCEDGETADTCPDDCTAVPGCGDGACEGEESPETCPADCGDPVVCGNGTCSEGEDCSSCSVDCGVCSVMPGSETPKKAGGGGCSSSGSPGLPWVSAALLLPILALRQRRGHG